MSNDSKQDYAYLRFSGPYVTEGKIDIEQAGKTLIALNRWFKKYKKEFLKTDDELVLRAGAIREGSSEVQFFLDILQNSDVHRLTLVAIGGSVFRNFGLKDFFQKFMGTLGEQLALKLLSKGNSLEEKERFADKGVAYVKLVNENGKQKVVSDEAWQVYQKTNAQLNGFCNLKQGYEEKMIIGYHDKESDADKPVSTLTYKDREYFQDTNDSEEWARRVKEPFDESKASEEKIVGQFVDYYALAHRYHFSFQARKAQNLYGKQKILCIVDEQEIPKILDLLKPKNKKNICIKGLATRDKENRVDKIKIEWINEDPNYNPDQTHIL